jgi:hypothetical protein
MLGPGYRGKMERFTDQTGPSAQNLGYALYDEVYGLYNQLILILASVHYKTQPNG